MIRKLRRAQKNWNAVFPDDKVLPGDGFVLHHIDEDPSNDSVLNLRKMTDHDHRVLHRRGKKHSKETLAKISNTSKGRKHSEETKKKLSLLNTGKKHSEASLEKMRSRTMSDAHKKHLSKINSGKVLSELVRKKISDSMKEYRKNLKQSDRSA